ncbi:TPA: hypothetical protein RUZ42_005067 [Klebsiella pneumoniae]|nr:hypothetical protein [Klebsiella pneumoniae]
MKIWGGLFLSSVAINSLALAAHQEQEYNTWYSGGVVLYGMTQTSRELPEMVGISQQGHNNANMVVSYIDGGRCDALKKAFNVNGQDVPATYTYANIENNQKIEHFAITDAKCVNGMVQHLKLDFTLVLQNDIKVWAANIKTPRYGVTPKFL